MSTLSHLGLWVRQLRHTGPPLALVALCLIFTVAGPHFARLENLQTILESAAVPLILSVGAAFVVIMGSIDLSTEGVIGATCVAITLLVHNSVNGNDLGLIGVLITLALGMTIGALNGVLNVYLRLPSLMATIGTWFVGLGFAYIIFPDHQPSLLYEPLSELVLKHFLGLNLLVYLAVAITIVAHLVFRFTVLGRNLYAIGGDEPTAIAAGIAVKRYRITAFSIAGLLFAVGGICIAAQLGNGYPNAGHDMLFTTIGATVIGGTLLSGGRGGPFHCAIGVLILKVLDNGMIQVGVGPYTRNIIVGATIIAAVAASNWHLRKTLRVVK